MRWFCSTRFVHVFIIHQLYGRVKKMNAKIPCCMMCDGLFFPVLAVEWILKRTSNQTNERTNERPLCHILWPYNMQSLCMRTPNWKHERRKKSEITNKRTVHNVAHTLTYTHTYLHLANQRTYWLRAEKWYEYYKSKKMMKIAERLNKRELRYKHHK